MSFVVSSENDTEVENDSGEDSEAGEDDCFVCGDNNSEAGEDTGFVRMSRLGSDMGGGGTEWDGEMEGFILLLLEGEKEEGLARN